MHWAEIEFVTRVRAHDSSTAVETRSGNIL